MAGYPSSRGCRLILLLTNGRLYDWSFGLHGFNMFCDFCSKHGKRGSHLPLVEDAKWGGLIILFDLCEVIVVFEIGYHRGAFRVRGKQDNRGGGFFLTVLYIPPDSQV